MTSSKNQKYMLFAQAKEHKLRVGVARRHSQQSTHSTNNANGILTPSWSGRRDINSVPELHGGKLIQAKAATS